MRLLIEIVVVAALIYLAWDKPFGQRFDDLRGKVSPNEVAEPTATRSPSPPGAWMSDPSRHSTLDAPEPSGSASTLLPKSGSSLLDPKHHSPLDPTHTPTPHRP